MEVVVPSAVTPELGEVESVEFDAAAAPLVKVTVPSLFVIGEVICRVLTWA